MAKSDTVGIRLDPQERDALQRAANADDRSMSALARKLLVEWLKEKGWLDAS
jgi:hypothetical protein